MKNVLIIELWNLGDATLMTSVLQGLLADNWKVTVLAKPQTRLLLQTMYPEVSFLEFEAPWTVFYGKYHLWNWPWLKIFQVLRDMHRQRFEAALSVRSDPRDHFLMWAGAVRRRLGFTTPWSQRFLNEPILQRDPNAHRVEDWWKLQDCLGGSASAHLPPRLIADPELINQFRARFKKDSRPVIALHCGARIPVRRWPEAYYRKLVLLLREKFDFQLALVPDPDGYGSALHDLADHTFSGLSVAELLALFSCATQIICNDSAPSHFGDALGIPVIAFFGPMRPEPFHPFQPHNLVVIRDICPHRPCFDYCRFPEPYCLTKLTTDVVWPDIENYLAASQRIPLKANSSVPT
ncbi:MAG: glycosyltransferase family 9 protein [Methylacidiphilales bacterium]|nr:glycosyltransferase family 9 protein [Candidatus Methylacidiphilales bacterium]